jgi:hypothetical protein
VFPNAQRDCRIACQQQGSAGSPSRSASADRVGLRVTSELLTAERVTQLMRELTTQ